MDQLINDLLSLSRITQVSSNNIIINMKSLVQSIIDENISTEDKEKIKFSITELPECYGDHTLMDQVWSNLIINAIKYSRPKANPVIEIKGYYDNNQIVYCIKDNGVGFNPKYKSKLFGVFQRLHSSDDFEGTGIGLAIVKRIIQKHGGTVWAEGEEGIGATFYFTIPKKVK
jgi:light-regulated signal transduction histidine kinase (bacteriophytochrome)